MPGPNRHTEGLIDFSDVTGSVTGASGEIRVNLGDATKGTGIDRSVPFWGIDGFLSRPADPNTNGAAQYLYFCDGNQRYAIGSRDRRFYSPLEPIDNGDRMIHAPSGIRIRLDNSEEAIEQIIPGGTKHYLGSDLFFVQMQAGTKIEMDVSHVDVTKLGTAESVALYAVLQAYENAMQNYIIAIHAAITPLLAVIEPPPTLGPLTLTLNAAFAALSTAQANAVNPILASSAVLRASPT